ncbi:major facilitator superfamily protein [Actinoplanes sp. SE50]|nr:major facilitator superfamily MFS_1 [Actinoplanes sp. SE50/110]ATO83967.1 major facilitator superfamily protein [Actinoplanes sp. SE50]SLM01377.1 major facilitator superfamily protein [Actinoplanes sp. SE50/110]
MLFGGPVVMAGPLLAVLIVDGLGLPPPAYGLALGVPCVGGIVGSRLAPVLVRRFGQRRVLLAAGVLRTPWMLLYPLARHGTAGLAIVMVADTLTLTCAGVFNPVFATYRMNVTADAYMTRVRTAWGVSAKTVQPLCVLAGGGLAALVGVRTTLFLAGLACLASGVLLPFRSLADDGDHRAGGAGLSVPRRCRTPGAG